MTMSRIRRYSMSSFCFNTAESGSDGTPAPNAARSSNRGQERLTGSLSVKTPSVPDQKTTDEDEPSERACWLTRLNFLPPLSPAGSQFANDIRQGNFNYADVVGDRFAQYLKDGMPGLEEVMGEEYANNTRRKIEVWRRGDFTELHDMLLPGNIFYPPDTWAAGEKSKVSRYPMAICTSGAMTMEQLVRARRSSVNDSATEVSKTTTPLSEAMRIREQLVYSSDSGDESSVSLTSSDVDDDSLQYSDYDSDEGQNGSALKEKSLIELFPYQRFRDDI